MIIAVIGARPTFGISIQDLNARGVDLSYEEKSAAMVDIMQTHNMYLGQSVEIAFSQPDMSDAIPRGIGDSNIYTGCYLGAECFRYAVTGAADAKANAQRSMQALLTLERVTPIKGLLCRGVMNTPKSGGQWHHSTTIDSLWWNGDVSTDQLDGWYFGLALYYDLVADEQEKALIAGVVDTVTQYIIDNGYRVIDVDGEQTTWAVWDPTQIAGAPYGSKWWFEYGLNPMDILSHLLTGIHMTGKQSFKDGYEYLITTWKYDRLAVDQKISGISYVNHNDDLLAYLAYYHLMTYGRMYETNQIRLDRYEQSMRRTWRDVRDERNTFFNVMHTVFLDEFNHLDDAWRSLDEMPTDRVRNSVVNSDRTDVPLAWEYGNFELRALVPLPIYERPVPRMEWLDDPDRLDGSKGGGRASEPSDFLMAYWMARYHQLIPDDLLTGVHIRDLVPSGSATYHDGHLYLPPGVQRFTVRLANIHLPVGTIDLTLSSTIEGVTVVGGVAQVASLGQLDTVTVLDGFEVEVAVSDTVLEGQLMITMSSAGHNRTYELDVYAGIPHVLIVDDDRVSFSRIDSYRERAYALLLSQTSVVWDLWSVEESGPPPIDVLKRFPVVLWETGSAVIPLDEQEQRLLSDYLDQGGRLLLTSRNAASALDVLGGETGASFLRDRLHSEYLEPNLWPNASVPIPMHRAIYGPMLDLPLQLHAVDVRAGVELPYPADLFDYGRQVSVDAIRPVNGGIPLYYPINSDTLVSAVAWADGHSAVVFCSFSIEGLYNVGSQRQLLTSMISWLASDNPITTVGADPQPDRPTSRIVRISPNPFNSTTTIRYSLAARQHVQLAVYNTFGQKVRVLDDRVKAAGFHTSVWNGRDFSGRNVASGVYFVRLTTQQTVQTHRMLLIR